MLSTLSQNFNGGRSRRRAANLAKLQANAAVSGSGRRRVPEVVQCGMSTPTGPWNLEGKAGGGGGMKLRLAGAQF